MNSEKCYAIDCYKKGNHLYWIQVWVVADMVVDAVDRAEKYLADLHDYKSIWEAQRIQQLDVERVLWPSSARTADMGTLDRKKPTEYKHAVVVPPAIYCAAIQWDGQIIVSVVSATSIRNAETRVLDELKNLNPSCILPDGHFLKVFPVFSPVYPTARFVAETHRYDIQSIGESK